VNTIWIKQDFRPAAAKLKGKFAAPSHATHILAEDSRIIAPDGTIGAVLLCDVIPSELHRRAYDVLKNVNGFVSNRATALGTISLPRSVNQNHVASSRSGVNEIVLQASPARQGILGCDRPRHLTKLTRKHPELLKCNRALIELVVDSLYAEHLPLFYKKQRAIVGKMPLWDTVFTTAYVGKQFRTAYHADGNLQGTMTAIVPLGRFHGGELVVPAWRIAFAYKPGDLLLIDAEQVHGNLPFSGKRVALVLFCGRWVEGGLLRLESHKRRQK
jgi:hypothetical protein